MKRILTSTALILAIATPAAMADVSMLRERVADVAQDVDVDSLTDEQVRALYAALASEDSDADQQNIIDSIVADSQYEMESDPMMADPEYRARMGASNNIRDAVDQMLTDAEFDVDVDNLSDEQVAALYLELTSGDQADNTDIEAILQ